MRGHLRIRLEAWAHTLTCMDEPRCGRSSPFVCYLQTLAWLLHCAHLLWALLSFVLSPQNKQQSIQVLFSLQTQCSKAIQIGLLPVGRITSFISCTRHVQDSQTQHIITMWEYTEHTSKLFSNQTNLFWIALDPLQALRIMLTNATSVYYHLSATQDIKPFRFQDIFIFRSIS